MAKFLPIGSVVVLKGGTKRVMICGRAQFDAEKKYYDYSGCIFPEGYLGANEMYLFNDDDVDRVFFIGLQDAEEIEYTDLLVKKIDELRASGELGA